MKRQLIISTLCLVLLMVMMLSTTLAWFTDNKSNVNTMVAGKISIEQKEYSDAAHTTEFENNKFVMMPSQTVIKEVVVTNTGNQSAYVRTLFAFEDSADGKVLEMLTTAGATITFPSDVSDNKIRFSVTKDGKTTIFTVGYTVCDTALPENSQFCPLDSITLSANAQNEWHKAVGNTYELSVLSQATQAAGLGNDAAVALNTAFAPITSENCAKWFAQVLGGTVSGTVITLTNP